MISDLDEPRVRITASAPHLLFWFTIDPDGVLPV
jgi:hypothetical protein